MTPLTLIFGGIVCFLVGSIAGMLLRGKIDQWDRGSQYNDPYRSGEEIL